MPPNGPVAAIVTAAVIIIIAIAALGVLYPADSARRARRCGRHARARALDDFTASAWIQAWRPTRADHAAALRLRRDLRRWIPRRRLP